jgi:hypothetical protein
MVEKGENAYAQMEPRNKLILALGIAAMKGR